MKLVTYIADGHGPRAGMIEESWVYDLGPSVLGLLKQGVPDYGARERTGLRFPINLVWLLAPVPDPRSFRDFYAFEQHVAATRAKRGLSMVADWYKIPVFYFANAGAISGPEAAIARPAYTRELDFALEIACVIGKQGRNIAAAEADAYIAGYMVLNDWSARDAQRLEMKMDLGPAKGKDFATSMGPWLVTPDELADRLIPGDHGARYDLMMTVWVNGKEYGQGNFKEIHFTFAEMIARASQDVTLYPGEVLGSGTVGNGCVLETGLPWLEPGDVVEMEIEHLGLLRNIVAGGQEHAMPLFDRNGILESPDPGGAH